MNKINIIFLIIAIASIFISTVFVTVNIYKTKTTMNRLNDMLDSAISGSFLETTYDESIISSLETKLSRFLSMSLFSKNNIATEKEKIKALISDISHQTKTPISNIILYSQLLNEQKQLPYNCYKLSTLY